VLAVAPALCLAACGGDGGSTTTAATATAAGAASTPAITSATASPSTSAAGGQSGPAAAFRVARGDNSVPEFGHEAPVAERKDAAVTLAVFLHARANHEWSAVCTYLPESMRQGLQKLAKKTSKRQPKSCGQVVAALSAHSAASVETLPTGVAALRVEGSNAFALFYGPDAGKYLMPMVRDGDAWKMTQLAPLAYPPALGAGPADLATQH
jgi:hypothetical protein